MVDAASKDTFVKSFHVSHSLVYLYKVCLCPNSTQNHGRKSKNTVQHVWPMARASNSNVGAPLGLCPNERAPCSPRKDFALGRFGGALREQVSRCLAKPLLLFLPSMSISPEVWLSTDFLYRGRACAPSIFWFLECLEDIDQIRYIKTSSK